MLRAPQRSDAVDWRKISPSHARMNVAILAVGLMSLQRDLQQLGSRCLVPPEKSQEAMMKTTLFLSTIAAGLMAVSTMTFAQNFGGYAQTVGEAYAGTVASPQQTAPIDRLTRSDLGYQRNVTGRRHKAAARQ
jgi:hypothetical protein